MGSSALNWVIRHRATVLIAIDLVMFQVALIALWLLRFESGIFTNPLRVDFSLLLYPALALTVYWLAVFTLRGVYRRKTGTSRYESFIDVLKAVVTGIVLWLVATWSNDPYGTSGMMVLTYAIALMLIVGFGHVAYVSFIRYLFKRRIGLYRSLIVGRGERGRRLYNTLQNGPEFGHEVVAMTEVEGDPPLDSDDLPSFPLTQLETYLEKHSDIEYVLIALEPANRDRVMDVIETAHFRGTRIMIMPDFFQILVGMAKSRELYGMPLLEIFPDPVSPAHKVMKRLLDLFAALLILTVGMPLMLILGVLVVSTSKGPALYVQRRTGYKGKEFKLYKFRSMYRDAEKHTGAVWATEKDPRITRVGRFLRTTRLDELPQAWNVLRGDMSLVGPRPERKVFVDQFVQTIPFYNRRHNVKPGITGWAQVRRGYDTSIEDVREKLQYDLFYLENMSIGLDIKILLNTMWVVIMGKGR